MSRVHIIFGPPGTGKTTRLVSIVKEYIDSGVDPERIGFMSFSRQAAKVAVDRMHLPAPDGLGIPKAKLIYFCTLHSIAFRLLRLGRKDVVTGKHYKELGEWAGYGFDESEDHASDVIDVQRIGVRCRQIYNLSRARMTDVETEWRKQNHKDLKLETVHKFVKNYEQYKESQFLLDFPDTLDRAAPLTNQLNLDILVVDEAQDLTSHQWWFAQQVGANCKKIFIGGDDDQAIYAWNGASAKPLQEFVGTREILPQSYRLPGKIHAFANKIVQQIKNRVPKEFKAREEAGEIYRLAQPEEVDLSHGTWLLLTRCRYGLEIWEKIAKAQNVVYFDSRTKEWSNNTKEIKAVMSWTKYCKGEKLTKPEYQNMLTFQKPGATMQQDWMHALNINMETETYIRGLKRRGEKLKGPGRVKIATYHGSKGDEAMHVALLTDTNRLIAKAFMDSELRDAELRNLYVAVTRAKNALYLVRPTRTNFYAI